MDREKVKEKMISIIADQFGKPESEIEEGNHLVADLGADSLDQVEIVMEIEDTFDVNVPDEVAEKVTTVKSAIDLVMELTA
jgi:acyl carrier protein